MCTCKLIYPQKIFLSCESGFPWTILTLPVIFYKTSVIFVAKIVIPFVGYSQNLLPGVCVILVQICAQDSTKSIVPFVFIIETKSPSMQGEGSGGGGGGGRCQQQHIEINISFSHKGNFV